MMALMAPVLAMAEPGPAQLTLDDLRTFTDAFNQVRSNYVEEVDDKTLLDAAIRGMLAELDPHSDYLPANDYDDLQEFSTGRYTGVGTEVAVENDRIVIRAVILDSPADEQGLNPGDIITAIDGEPVKGRYLPDAVDDMMGEPGTRTVLDILTPAGEERRVTLERKSLKVPTLGFQVLDDTIGYYSVSSFHSRSALDLQQSIDSVLQDGIMLDSLVIDLRGNAGGMLQPAIAMADGFLEEGLIVSTRGRNSVMQMEFSAHPGQWLADIPLTVLVNHASASASEVLAGALQDHGRAVIVGERTFGKGSVQSVLPMRNGSGIKLTTARYYTPAGRSIQALGIVPDVLIDEGGGSREADLDGHLHNGNETGQSASLRPTVEQVNPQLGRTLAALRAEGILPAVTEPES
jgi:carboxyl-terminal processing protease